MRADAERRTKKIGLPIRGVGRATGKRLCFFIDDTEKRTSAEHESVCENRRTHAAGRTSILSIERTADERSQEEIRDAVGVNVVAGSESKKFRNGIRRQMGEHKQQQTVADGHKQPDVGGMQRVAAQLVVDRVAYA